MDLEQNVRELLEWKKSFVRAHWHLAKHIKDLPDGAALGDADTLDGYDSTHFAVSGHSHTAPAHNDTTSKQGGTTNEYYHLTSAQHADLAAGFTPLYLSLVAGEALGGHRVVRIADDGKAWYADQSEPTHIFRIIGITTGAVDSGATVAIQTSGLMTEGSWTWTVGTPIWLSTGGQLTQTAPVTGFQFIIAQPQTATSILIRPTIPIVLAA